MTLAIYLKDSAGTRQAQIDDWQTLNYSDKWRGIGDFAITFPLDADMSRYVKPGTGILVFKNTELKFSGIFVKLRIIRSETGLRWEMTGSDDGVWLSRRLVHPCQMTGIVTDPGDRFGESYIRSYYKEAAYDIKSGSSEEVIKAYVAQNLARGPVAESLANARDVNRLINMQIAPVRGEGSDAEGKGRFEKLDEFISDLCIEDDVGWSVRPWVPGYSVDTLVFDTHQPRQVADTIKFDIDLGTLTTLEFERNAPKGNYVVVAGEGDLTERDFYEGASSRSVANWGRIESELKEVSSAEFPNDLIPELGLQYSQLSERSSLAFTPFDTDYQQFGLDYQVGDFVTFSVAGVQDVEMIREASVSYANGNPTPQVELVIGSDDNPPNVLELFNAQANLGKRTYAKERR